MDSPVSICATGCICAAGDTTDSCFETMLDGQVFPTFEPEFSYDGTMQSPVFTVKQEWVDQTESNCATDRNHEITFQGC